MIIRRWLALPVMFLLPVLLIACRQAERVTPTAVPPLPTLAIQAADTPTPEPPPPTPTAEPPTPTAEAPSPRPMIDATPTAGEESGAEADSTVQASIQLPAGDHCLFAGTGATLAFDGKRLNYTCTDPNAPATVLLGNPQLGESGQVTVTQGIIVHGDEGFALESSEVVTALLAVVVLPDGTWCRHAGFGATLAFDGKRLNYSCGEPGDNELGLIGDLQNEAGVLMAEQATLGRDASGFVLEATEMVAVTPLRIDLDSGIQCLSSGEGATLAFVGQRVNYTCSDPNAPITGLLGDFTQVQETVWSVEHATLARGADGFTLETSEVITYRIEHLDLANGMRCAFAGEGATLAFAGKRLNYTCGEPGDASLGILGDVMQGEAGVWTVELATIARGSDGFALESTEIVAVTAIHGGAPPADARASAPSVVQVKNRGFAEGRG
jgi:hypothetical protein